MLLRSRFVSLGGDCQPVHNIRLLHPNVAPSVFDWIGTPSAAIIELINNNFDSFFEDLRWVRKGDPHWEVWDTRYDIQSVHHFDAEDPTHVKKATANLRYLARLFMDQIRSEEPICYVRRRRETRDPAYDEDARRLYHAVRSINPNTAFLYVDHDAKGVTIEDGFMTAFSPKNPHGTWKGDPEIWARNLRIAGVMLEHRSTGLTVSTRVPFLIGIEQ